MSGECKKCGEHIIDGCECMLFDGKHLFFRVAMLEEELDKLTEVVRIMSDHLIKLSNCRENVRIKPPGESGTVGGIVRFQRHKKLSVVHPIINP